MSKTLAVFGATGHQGSGIINYVLNDPELSQQYKIRAITRDVNSDKAKKLKENVEVVQGDALNRASLEKALEGAHTIFAMTTPDFSPDALEVEYNIGKTIADVAVQKGVEYLIFSTLPSVREFSGGKYTKITPFDAKAKAEQYIRGLPIKSAFYSPGFFMENFAAQPFMGPQKAPDGTWVLYRSSAPKTLYPYIDATGDSGKFVGAILADPEKYEGKTFCAAQTFYTMEDITTILSKTTRKKIIYKQISREEFKKQIPFAADLLDEALAALDEFGYWGKDSEKLVAWAIENARGRLTTLEEFFNAHPLQLT
jgi:uncharacterized protein YbjT (DUF2867 family)